MKILLITTGLNYGGQYKMLTWVANQLVDSSDVTILKLLNGDISQKLRPEINLIDYGIFWPNSRFDKIFSLIKIENSISEVLRSNNYDCVISFGDIFSMLMLLKTRRANCKFIVSERGDPNIKTKIGKFRKFLFSFADVVVFQTEGAKDCFNKTVRKKSVVIPNPVSKYEVKRTCKKRKDEIVFAGRFEIKQKRQDLMIDAFNLVHKKFPSTHLVFYGDGKDLDICINKSNELELQDYIHFMGRVSDLPQAMCDSKLFVLCSDYEGIPNSLIEAMSIGLPVVSTDCRPGGARLLIRDGFNGRLVKCNDVVELSSAICDMLSDSNRAEEMGMHAKDIVVRFSPDRIRKKWFEIVF